MEAPKRLNYPHLITRDTSPSRADLEVFVISSSDGCPVTATCLASTQALRSRRVSSASKHLGAGPSNLIGPGGLTAPPGRLNRPGWPQLLVESSASVLWINRVTQWFSGEPLQTPRTLCSLRQSPLMTRLPRSPGSTLVLSLYQETVHDFILLFMPPCGPHLTPLATGSLERSLLVHTWRPHWQRPFALVLHLHQHESSRNLHLQYLDKNQSIQRCQSLITQGRDHPPVLEPHMVLSFSPLHLSLPLCSSTPILS
jgi:hypothetical protein